MNAKSIDFDAYFEKLGRIPKGARYGAVVAILSLGGAGYYFLFFSEDAALLTTQQSRAQVLQRKLTNVRAVANNVGEFEQEVAALERELQIALRQLPNRKQFEDLLQDITTAGKQVGVVIKSIVRAQEVGHDFYVEVPFELQLEGSYHDLAMFFERVAKLPRIVNIGSMRIQSHDGRDSTTLLKVEGTATTFRFLDTDENAA